GLSRVCVLGSAGIECDGRPGGVIRFLVPYAVSDEVALVYATCAGVSIGEAPRSGKGFEVEFEMERKGATWKIRIRRTVAALAE
ncbi:MAG: hypothetical protein ABJB66_20500, partial [Gemmatimonadaceae bacterium]